jgi:hypothetical protein
MNDFSFPLLGHLGGESRSDKFKGLHIENTSGLRWGFFWSRED